MKPRPTSDWLAPEPVEPNCRIEVEAVTLTGAVPSAGMLAAVWLICTPSSTTASERFSIETTETEPARAAAIRGSTPPSAPAASLDAEAVWLPSLLAMSSVMMPMTAPTTSVKPAMFRARFQIDSKYQGYSTEESIATPSPPVSRAPAWTVVRAVVVSSATFTPRATAARVSVGLVVPAATSDWKFSVIMASTTILPGVVSTAFGPMTVCTERVDFW